MKERNLCAESGCPAACCRNITGHVAGRAEFFLRAFPNAIRLETKEELREKVGNQENGVYFLESQGWTYFSVSGDCPNLLPDNNCGIHGQTFYPKACINMLMGSSGCDDAKTVFVINGAFVASVNSA